VDVKEQLSAAVGGGVCFDPGTDLDGLLAAFLLRAGLFTPVFLAQQHEPDRERAHGADRRERVHGDGNPVVRHVRLSPSRA
jgi:hypothetical protein